MLQMSPFQNGQLTVGDVGDTSPFFFVDLARPAVSQVSGHTVFSPKSGIELRTTTTRPVRFRVGLASPCPEAIGFYSHCKRLLQDGGCHCAVLVKVSDHCDHCGMKQDSRCLFFSSRRENGEALRPIAEATAWISCRSSPAWRTN